MNKPDNTREKRRVAERDRPTDSQTGGELSDSASRKRIKVVLDEFQRQAAVKAPSLDRSHAKSQVPPHTS